MRAFQAPFEFEDLDELLAAIGRSDIAVDAIAHRLLELESGELADAESGKGLKRALPPTSTAPKPKAGRAEGVMMMGAGDLHTKVARCCSPLPGEEVIGYITRGQGVTLHRLNCSNIARQRKHEPDRFKRVIWERTERQSYPVEVRIEAYDRTGLVKDITEALSVAKVVMTEISAVANPNNGQATVTVIVELPARAQLAGLIDRLGDIRNVIRVYRPAG